MYKRVFSTSQNFGEGNLSYLFKKNISESHVNVFLEGNSQALLSSVNMDGHRW